MSEQRDLNLAAAKLAMSPTMTKAAIFSQDFPFDLTDAANQRTALITGAVDVVRAMDAGEITADKLEARAALMGLITTALMVSNSGKPLALEEVSTN